MSLSHFVVDFRRDKTIMENLKDTEIPTSQNFQQQIHDYSQIMESEEVPKETPDFRNSAAENSEDPEVFPWNSAFRKLKIFDEEECNCQCCQRSEGMKKYERLREFTIGWVQDMVKSQHEFYDQLNRLVQNQFKFYYEINKFFTNVRDNDKLIKTRNMMEKMALSNRLIAQNILRQRRTGNQSE